MSYKQILEQSDSLVAQGGLVFRVESAKLQLQADLLEQQKALSQARQQLKTVYFRPFNSSDIIDAKMVVRSLENGLKELEELQAELFPA